MTRFDQSVAEGQAKKIYLERIKAKSLLKSAEEAVSAAKKFPFEPTILKSILRELYEGFRQYCEAIGYLRGYKFLSHEVIVYFLEDVLQEKAVAARFDRYRKIRNGINYYGDDVSPETVKEALAEIPMLIEKLRQYTLELRK